MTTSSTSSSLATVLCSEQQKLAKVFPHLKSHNLISHKSRVRFHVRRVAGPGAVQGAQMGEDDHDSAGGSTSSSTGFGSFVRIASASSYICKRGTVIECMGSMLRFGKCGDGGGAITYWHELHVLEEFLYETS